MRTKAVLTVAGLAAFLAAQPGASADPKSFGAATTVRPGSGSSSAEAYERKSFRDSRESSIECRLAVGRGAARSAMRAP